jgi:16S rRNA (guanine(966)-N(2))-methyltransferase RsmD
MRIIAGLYKGRSLLSVKDPSVRPATDRVKGSIFNMLQNRLNLRGASVLDLFAGTGSLGFESLSRGAASVVFVELGGPAAAVIRENMKKLNCTEACDIMHVNALDYISRCAATYDLIFADPPYAFSSTDKLPWLMFSRGLVREGGILIIEHTHKTSFPEDPLYVRNVHKKFGATEISFFTNPTTKA